MMAVTNAIRVAAPFQYWRTASPPSSVPRLPTANLQPYNVGPSASRLVMVLDVVLGGMGGGLRFRAATVPLDSVEGPQQRSARAALIEEPTLTNAIRLGEGASQGRSLVFTLRPDASLAIAPFLAGGGIPYGIAEVSLQLLPTEGAPTPHDERIVVMRGVVSKVTFGGMFPPTNGSGDRRSRGFEFIELEVADPRDLCQSWLPPWIIDGDGVRWPSPSSTAIGARYPICWNGFDYIPAIRVTSNGTGAQKFIFMHQGTAPSGAYTLTGVFVNGVAKGFLDATYGWSLTIFQVDGIDTPLWGIDFTNAATVWSSSDAVHVSTSGFRFQDRRSIIGVIQDVCEKFSSIGTEGTNRRLFSEAEARIPVGLVEPRVLLNASGGGAAAGALDFIEQTLCAQYPMISMAWEEGGYGPIVVDYRLPAVASFVAGASPLLKRASAVQTDTSGIANGFIYRYGYNALLDVYTKVIVRDASNSGLCAYSESFLGPRAADPIESPYVQDDGTANYILDWLVAHRSLPTYVVEYDCTPAAFLSLRRGDTVLLTDDEFGWTSERATIESIEYTRGHVRVMLRVFVRGVVDVGGSALSVPPAM